MQQIDNSVIQFQQNITNFILLYFAEIAENVIAENVSF